MTVVKYYQHKFSWTYWQNVSRRVFNQSHFCKFWCFVWVDVKSRCAKRRIPCRVSTDQVFNMVYFHCIVSINLVLNRLIKHYISSGVTTFFTLCKLHIKWLKRFIISTLFLSWLLLNTTSPNSIWPPDKKILVVH
jgi:hypothetical protein